MQLSSPLDKLLPPIPKRHASEHIVLEQPHPNKNETPVALAPGVESEPAMLMTKTLRRKNFKQLSLKLALSERSLEHPASSNLITTRPAPGMPSEQWPIASSQDASLPDLSALLLHPYSGSSERDGLTNLNRKRQTIISSISPTHLSAPSPVAQGILASPILSQSANLLPSGGMGSPICTTNTMTLNNTDLVTLKSLGAGTSGTVTKILHVPTKRIMAKKIIPIDLKTVIKTQIIRELRILHECHSPFIIDFYGAFVSSSNKIVICMEYCNCGLLDKISTLCLGTRQFPLFALKKLAFAILSGLTYLYNTHKIIHRDIKPLNVLMTHRGEFKLCDFGVSRELSNSLAVANTFVGTSTYMLPERIQGLEYSIKSDVWSMGLMLVELASGKPVWQDDVDDHGAHTSQACNGGPEGILDLLQRIVNETPPSLSGKINPTTNSLYDSALCQFVDSCLMKSERDRKLPMELLLDSDGFLADANDAKVDANMKVWTKSIRKMQKEQ